LTEQTFHVKVLAMNQIGLLGIAFDDWRTVFEKGQYDGSMARARRVNELAAHLQVED
jgi:hypothetical protein